MTLPKFVDVLTNLDYLLEHNPQSSLQDPAFSKHKRRILQLLARSFDNQYTQRQIERRINQEIRAHYQWPRDKIRFLFVQGSDTLTHLATDTKQEIRSGVQSRHLNEADETAARRSGFNVSTRTSHRNSPQTLRLAICSSKKFQQSRNLKVRSEIASPGELERQTESNETEQISTHCVAYQSPDSDDVIKVARPCSPDLNNVKDEKSPLAMHNKHVSEEANVAEEVILNENKEFYQQSDFECSKLLELAAGQDYYRQRCQLLEDRERTLSIELRQLEVLNGNETEVVKTLLKCRQRVADLKQKLKRWSELDKCIPKLEFQAQVSLDKNVYNLLEKLKQRLPSLLVLEDEGEPNIVSLCGRSADLDELLLLVFGPGCGYALSQHQSQLSPFRKRDIMVALTGAAIHEWIFRAPWLPWVTISDSVLNETRNVISTLFDEELACKVDLAAHRSKLDDPFFEKKTLPHYVNVVSTRIVDALRPLLGHDKESRSDVMFRQALNAILKIAIRARAESLVSSESFESFWPCVGEPLRLDEHEPYCTNTAGPASVVKLPLCPGFRAYVKTPAMVSYEGLAGKRTNFGQRQYVVKALVAHKED